MAPDAQTFRRAEAIRRQSKKAIDKWCVNQYESEQQAVEMREQLYEREINSAIYEFKEVLLIQKRLNEVYDEVMGDEKKDKQWYHITIRPDCRKISFNQFYEKIKTLMDRQCFIDYTLSFEQTGETTKELGTGFHVHIVANTTHASKGQCLRDMKSSFNQWIKTGVMTPECIDVVGSKTPNNIIEKYLTEYESADGHKVKTKEWDTAWRESIGLLPLYRGVVPTLSFNKPVTDKVVLDSRVRENPQTITFD